MTDDRTARFLRLLEDARNGDARAVDRVIPLVYDELHALAAHHLNRERAEHTLQPTALVHEVYLRMLRQEKVDWQSRGHFIRIAAEQIRRVLVDHARARNRQKREGALLRVTLSEGVAVEDRDVDLLRLSGALDRLDAESPEDRAVVEMKYFGGLTEAEIAAILGTSERTVRRRWTFARAWLFRALAGTPEQAP